MYLKIVIPNTVNRRLSSIVMFCGPLVTLVVTPWFNYDPINLGKTLVLSSLSFAGIGLLVPFAKSILKQLGNFLVSIIFFLQ